MKYKKASGKRELLPSSRHGQKRASSDLLGSTEGIEDVELAYSKGDAVTDAHLFFLFVEGESKEMDYFKYLQEKNKYNNLRVISVPMSNSQEYEGSLVSKISFALDKATRTGLVTYKSREMAVSDIDSIYVVIDVDDLYEQIKAEKGKSDMATWIISNPCFEIWLYYTYYDSPQQDLALELLDISKRSKVLKARLNDLHKGGIGCRDAFRGIQNACANSMKNYEEDAYGMPMLYSTKMHVLALDIYNIIESEHKERLRLRQDQIAKFHKAND